MYLLFIFDKQVESEHWSFIIIISILTGINAYCNLAIQDFSNLFIKKINFFLSLILFY